MISESVIIFSAKGNVVIVLNDELPKDMPVMFRVGSKAIDLMVDENVIYSEPGLSPYICDRLRKKNEIGVIEVKDPKNPPKHITNVMYQQAS